jgi:uncharacterized protein (TIGR02145 family)
MHWTFISLGNNKSCIDNLKKISMRKKKTIITVISFVALLFSYVNMSGNIDYSSALDSDRAGSKYVQPKIKSAQPDSIPVKTKTKPAQTSSKSTQTKSKTTQKNSKAEPDKKESDVGIVRIGTQSWALANLDVCIFRNGDSILQARTNKEWVSAGESGKPAWCYYNNDPAIGLKYGKLYNWYAVNDPRGLAPAGWTLPADDDWVKLGNYLGAQGVAGSKMKSINRWNEGNNGTNESGFNGFPGGYRVENGAFLNIGSIGTWWSTTELNPLSSADHYLAQSNSLGRSSSPKQRGESVRCLRKQ